MFVAIFSVRIKPSQSLSVNTKHTYEDSPISVPLNAHNTAREDDRKLKYFKELEIIIAAWTVREIFLYICHRMCDEHLSHNLTLQL